ncbi:hypothetical protein [Nitrosophilus kaiyonis]|uniref:hypothetical protein n=1 Tax=Nitrosophilus kaiyonis TaxID=2930200 RepID=UPI002490F6F7|nr:hypothetical protein [Nitrosophilus kaiyonis]
MKKFFLIILIFFNLFASVENIEREIYSTIIKSIFPKKETVKIWVDDNKKVSIFKKIDFAKITDNYENSDILFIFHEKSLKDIKTDKIIIFVGKYSLIKNYQNRVIGGFFWQKGRPNIIFLRKNLQKFNISLPKEFNKYIEDRV